MSYLIAGKTRLLVTTIAIMLLMAVALACGTSAIPTEENPDGLPFAAQDADPTATPEPTASPEPTDDSSAEGEGEDPTPTPEACPHTEGTYPNLDATLQKLVQKYETCELSESDAAALSPDAHGNLVLVQTVAPSQYDSLEKWMEGQSIRPRYRVPSWTNYERIYAFVPVSLLGTLASRTGVTEVAIPEDYGYRNTVRDFPAPTNTARGHDSTSSARAITADGPELPWWLDGYEHPRTYPKMRGVLASVMAAYESGRLGSDYRSHELVSCGFHPKGSDRLYVTIRVFSLVEAKVVEKWLQDNGVIPAGASAGFRDYGEYGPTSTSMGVPFGKLIPLTKVPELDHVYFDGCSNESTTAVENPGPTVYLGGDPQIGSYDTVGRTLHGVDKWKAHADSFTGSGKKIGIIDSGFVYLEHTGVAGVEVPSASQLTGHYWPRYKAFGDDDYEPTTDVSTCATYTHHGTHSVEVLSDMAPGAELLLSNVNTIVDLDARNEKFHETVKWMVKQGADVINLSTNYGFMEGLGRGEFLPWSGDIGYTVRQAAIGWTIGGVKYDPVIWAVSVGNRGQQNWYGPYQRSAPVSPAGVGPHRGESD